MCERLLSQPLLIRFVGILKYISTLVLRLRVMSYVNPHLIASNADTSVLTSMRTSKTGTSEFEPDVSSFGVAVGDRLSNSQSYILAQSFDQDVLGDIKSGFTNFVETGQVWALLIGLVLGFVIRGLTR